MPDLPRPKVEVTRAQERDSSAEAGSMDVVISRDGKAKSYRSVGGDVKDVVRDVVEKVIGDAKTGEWLPR